MRGRLGISKVSVIAPIVAVALFGSSETWAGNLIVHAGRLINGVSTMHT
jgi:hypothetical protein